MSTKLNVFEVLELVESAKGSNLKVSILEEHKKTPYLKDFFRLAEDTYIDFGVRKVPDFKKYVSPDSHGLTSEEVAWSFLDLLENSLAPRKITGNAAKESVAREFAHMGPIEHKWCSRLLLRNLRCGVSGKLVNRIWPGIVEPFAVLLATAVPVDKSNVPVGLKFPVRVEPKLDGLRCIAIKSGGAVTLYTRSGSVLETLPRIKKDLEDFSMDNFVLDGEAMVNRADQESWNDSASIIMSHKNQKDDADMTLNVFDAMDLEDWKNRTSMPLLERLTNRDTITSLLGSKSVCAVQGKTVNSLGELVAYYDACLDAGYEGIMIKDLKGLYEWKRVKTSVMKYKPIETYEGVVVGWYKGGVGTKHEDIFGGFHVLTPNGAITRVGGGFNDALRNEIGKDPSAYMGRIAEVEGAKGLTVDGKIRFPVFTRWRMKEDVDPKILETYEGWKERTKGSI